MHTVLPLILMNANPFITGLEWDLLEKSITIKILFNALHASSQSQNTCMLPSLSLSLRCCSWDWCPLVGWIHLNWRRKSKNLDKKNRARVLLLIYLSDCWIVHSLHSLLSRRISHRKFVSCRFDVFQCLFVFVLLVSHHLVLLRF